MAETEKTDLERVGLFVDGPYDTDVTLFRADIQAIMGRDFVKDDPNRLYGPFPVIPGHKLKAATNDWTFSPFLYLWEEEPYDDPGAWRRRYKAEQAGKEIGDGPFISAFGNKTMNGLGTYYGTFIKNLEAFSPETVEEKDDGLKGVPNFITQPGKKGTGYGYLDVTINKYPEYMEDPLYDLTEARRQMREAFETAMSAISDSRWVPTANPGGFFDPNPFGDKNDPEGTNETYDWDRLLPTRGYEDLEPWFPPTHTKKINGNKDVIAPLERFPSYDPSDPWEPVPRNVFRPYDSKSDIAPWKPSIGSRTRQSCSTIQHNIKLWVNPTTFHLV